EERKQREKEEGNRLLYVAMTRAEDHLLLTWSASGRKPENWAATVAQALSLDVDAECDTVQEMAAPDGKRWNLRYRCPAGEPPSTPPGAAACITPVEDFTDLPSVTGQYETNATVTDVVEFDACPRRYYLGRYLGFSGA